MILKNGVWWRGDCMDVMKRIPDGSVDMILCDLPYGTTQNKWDSVIPFEPLWREYWRVCKPRAAVVLTAQCPFTSALVMSQIQNFRHEWVWIKNRGSNFLNVKREPMKEHENVLVFSLGKWIYNGQKQKRSGGGLGLIGKIVPRGGGSDNYGEYSPRKGLLSELRVPSSWQKFNTSANSIHPTQKPVALFEYLIRTYTNAGDVVLDNCAGSGTTAIACENLDRHWVCIERDPDYSRLAIERITAHDSN